MPYANQLEINTLLAERSEFTAVKTHLEKISLLSEGGWRLRDAIRLFLKQRPGEEVEVYQNRLDKFTYSNVLGGAISQLAAKFSNGTITLESATPDKFWADFRADTDGLGRSEDQLLSRLVSELIKYRSVYVQIDKPVASVVPLNLAQQDQLGLRPKTLVHSACQVPMWHSEGGRLKWVKLFQLYEDSSDPTRKPLTKAVWTFIDDAYIARYEHYVRLNKAGAIAYLINEKGEDVNPVADAVMVPLVSEIAHGFGEIPIVKIELDASLWSGNQAYPVAEQSLALECHRYALESAAYMQRSYRKPVKPTGTLDEVFEENDGPLPTGLQYVIELDAFEWNEPSGLIIEPISKTLEEATRQIRTILGTGGAYVQGVIEASGVSKAMDFVIEDDRLEAYGHIVSKALTTIYRLVAVAGGHPPTVEVNGLDNFSRDRLEEFVAVLAAIASIDFSQIQTLLTPSLYLLLREKLFNFLFSNLSAEQQKELERELLSVPTDVNQADTSTGGDNQPDT